jgi:hypothetical protein
MLVLLALCIPHIALAQKTDVVYLTNGDRITGKVSEMNRGEMKFETDTMGYVYIRWEHVAGMETDKTVQFETTSGAKFFGSVGRADNGDIVVSSGDSVQRVAPEQVVHFSRIKADQTVWQAMDKDLRVGFSYTQASEIMRWSIGGGLNYKALTYRASLTANSLVTNNREGQDTRRADITGSFHRYLKNRFFWFASASTQTNDELGVDGRLLVSGGAGRWIFQKSRSELRIALGFAANYENPTGDPLQGSSSDTTLEGLLDIDWTVFKLSTPSSRVHAKLEYYPGLSESGRNRVDVKLNLRQEFIKDFFWVLEGFYSHDSDPPPGAVSGDDFGITTSLAYEW